MKALVFYGPGERAWETVPDPALAAETDAVVSIDSVTICGTDLHILKGDVPEVEPGTILGHEAIGTVVETGSAVTTLDEGETASSSRASPRAAAAASAVAIAGSAPAGEAGSWAT